MQHAYIQCFACMTAQYACARSEMRVTWTQRFIQTPVVRYGPAPNTGKPLPFSYPLAIGASPDTYVQSDLCGDPVRAVAGDRHLEFVRQPTWMCQYVRWSGMLPGATLWHTRRGWPACNSACLHAQHPLGRACQAGCKQSGSQRSLKALDFLQQDQTTGWFDPGTVRLPDAPATASRVGRLAHQAPLSLYTCWCARKPSAQA